MFQVEALPLSIAVWPLPSFNGRAPAIVDTCPQRTCVDLAYPRDAAPASLHQPAIVAHDGVVAFAGRQLDGYAVLVDHENGWATYYANLERLFVTPTSQRVGRGQRVKRGDIFGEIGVSTRYGMRALRFELWRLGEDRHYQQVDPTEHMKSWLVLPWADDRATPTSHCAA